MKTGVVQTSAALTSLLERRYPKSEYALLTQVRNGTGFDRHVRTADAIALSLWPSRGLVLSGFEIKCYRGDWQREKKNPAKAESIAQFCDFWWLVVAKAEIAPLDEVPETWGVLAPSAKLDRLVVVKPAEKNAQVLPLDRGFIAAILRNVSDSMAPIATLEQKVSAAYEQGKNDAERFDPANAEFTRLQQREKAWQLFEQAMGLNLVLYNGQLPQSIVELAQTVRLVRAQKQTIQGAFYRSRRQVTALVEALRNLSTGQMLTELESTLVQLDKQLTELQNLEVAS